MGISIPLLKKSLELIIKLEGLNRQPSVINDEESFRRHNAFVSHTLAAIHPSLISDVTVRALKLCGRLCGVATDTPDLITMIIDKINGAGDVYHELRITEAVLTKAFKKACVDIMMISTYLSKLVAY